MISSEQTIAAVATATGGAISIIRISGKCALEIADRIFIKTNGQKLSQANGYTVHFGNIEYNGEIIDNALATVFRAPHSYTGEDSVEFSCHGSQYIADKTIEALIANGARPATQGEFTKRAFLNGKMDLSQAEAVADIIASDSRAFHQIAMNQMKGSYSSAINALRGDLVELAALLELELDFSEEDVEFADRSRLRNIMQRLNTEIERMCQSFRSGNALKDGVPVAIVGSPNVGKSTLLNALVGEQRAIVSNIAGTTRDTIEEVLFINGVKFRLIDTAGIRQSEDVIETMGIERSKKAVASAEVVLLVCDEDCIELPTDLELENKRVIVVFNKRDIRSNAVSYTGEYALISAKSGDGLDSLREMMSSPYSNAATQGVTVTNARHYDALQRSGRELDAAQQALDMNLSPDLVVEHVRVIINILGEITGEITSDEILGTIFAKFCIGK